MKFIVHTLTHIHYAMAHIWDCDPLRRRPLSQLASVEKHLFPRKRRRNWSFGRK